MKIKHLIKKLSEKDISSSFTHCTWLATLENGGYGVWRPLPRGNLTQAKNEVGVYEVSKIVDFDGIPETEFSSHAGMGGSLRRYIDGFRWQDSRFGGTVPDQDTMQTLAIFDFLILHEDRSLGNLIVTKENKWIGIDNEATLRFANGISFSITYCMGAVLCSRAKHLIERAFEKKNLIASCLLDLGIESGPVGMVERRAVALGAIVGFGDPLTGMFGIK